MLRIIGWQNLILMVVNGIKSMFGDIIGGLQSC